MITTIGIDPHKATHTAVAIDETEAVLGEITVNADRYQTARLLEWASHFDGDHRLWAIEAAGGLGYLLSQQLVARGESVVDVPAVLASRVRVLGSGRSDRTTPTMPGRWRSRRCGNPTWLRCGAKTTPRCSGCWQSAISSSPVCEPRQCVASMRW